VRAQGYNHGAARGAWIASREFEQVNMRSLRRIACGAAGAFSILVAGHVAHAQDAAALAARRGLIEQAQAARVANNHQQSLDLAERAARIQMTPSLRLFIAQEQYSLHRLAEAFGNADACMREAEADTQARNREQVAQTCRSLSQELRTQIGHVVVHPPGTPPQGMQITVNGSALTDALWGVPYVVTPGHVTVVAHANGFRDFSQELDVSAGASSDVQVNLQAAPVTQTTTQEQHHDTAQQTTATPHEGGGGLPAAVPLAIAGVGVAAIIAGALFFIPRGSEINATTSMCPNFVCPSTAAEASAQPHQSAATTWTYLAYGVGGAGVAVAAVGAILFFVTRPSSSNHAPATGFHVVPTGDGVSVGLHGSF
jgi:hypothetical protein